jgi:hypothetical protein
MDDDSYIYPPVVVWWDDAWGEDKSVCVREVEHVPFLTYTIGWLIRNDHRGVTIAMDSYPEIDSTDHVRNYAFIPKGMIVKIDYLEKKEGP